MSHASHGDPPFVSVAPTRGLWWIGFGIVGLAVLAVVIVLALGTRQARTFDAGTPERALQDYLAAFDAGDYATAYGFFSADARSQTSESEYRAGVPMYGPGYDPSSQRVIFDRRKGSGDHVVLELTIEEMGIGVGGQVYRSSRQVPMVRQGGSWRIDELLIRLDPGPWPYAKPV